MTGKSCLRITGVMVSLLLLLFSCAGQAATAQKRATVAVWDLDDFSPSASQRTDLGALLSGQIIETIQQKGGYEIVERERLLLALEELRLGSSSLADESTRLRLGRLVGARYMIFGGYQVIGGSMRIDLRLVEVETGRIVKAVQKVTSSSDLTGWLDSAKRAAAELL